MSDRTARRPPPGLRGSAVNGQSVPCQRPQVSRASGTKSAMGGAGAGETRSLQHRWAASPVPTGAGLLP